MFREKRDVICFTIWLVQLVATLYFIYNLFTFDMIPDLYSGIVVIIFAALLVLTFVLFMKHSHHHRHHHHHHASDDEANDDLHQQDSDIAAGTEHEHAVSDAEIDEHHHHESYQSGHEGHHHHHHHHRHSLRGTIRRVIAGVISVSVIAGTLIGGRALGQVTETIEAVTVSSVDTTGARAVMGVYVLKDDPAQTLDDVKSMHYSIGMDTGADHANAMAARDVLSRRLGTETAFETFASAVPLAISLENGKTKAIVLNEAYIDILEEYNEFLTFGDRVRLVDEIPVYDEDVAEYLDEEEAETAETVTVVADPKKAKGITGKTFAIYISGSDTREATLTTSRSDVNILIFVNPLTKKMLMVTTPRDFYIKNPAGNGALDKLTHCGVYGINNSVEALEQLYDINIDYNAQINFTGFEKLVDAVGGVNVYVDEDIEMQSGSLKKGDNQMNGAMALEYVRERYRMAGGDRDRGKNQVKVLKAIIKKATTGTTILKKYTQILDSMKGMFMTSMSSKDISALVKMQLSDMAEWEIRSYAVDGKGDYATTFSMPDAEAYVMKPDKKTVETAKKMIQEIYDGK